MSAADEAPHPAVASSGRVREACHTATQPGKGRLVPESPPDAETCGTGSHAPVLTFGVAHPDDILIYGVAQQTRRIALVHQDEIA